MATETIPTNEYPLPKDSYAAFDAISLRNLIIERLNNQGILTDQNYIGSNLASIIDIISYSFNTLMFYLNRTSTESMFTEAQLYENINRIVKLLDYKPIGYQTSTLVFQCSAQGFSPGIYTIPRYSYLNLGSTAFSFNEDISFTFSETLGTTQLLQDVSNKKLLYQGTFRENPIHTAAGDENEIVVINNNTALIDHFNIDVYVFETDQNRWVQYSNTTTLYNEPSFARAFEKRLNSDLTYEITFGDGINGRKLERGDRVLVYYLQSSGTAGVVGPQSMSPASKQVYSSANFQNILQDTADNVQFISNNQLMDLFFENIVGSTIPKPIENADSIRKNAPANFKSQYRLVTKQDFQTFITTNHSTFINDVRVFSNWDYVGKYLKYFNDIQVSPSTYRQILFNQVAYADSCNFNNIYICAIPKIARTSTYKRLLPAQKELLLSDIQQLKTITTEVTFMDPIIKAFDIGLETVNGEIVVSDRDFCRLEVVKLNTSKRSAKAIANDVAAVFRSYFDPTLMSLGGTFDHSGLIGELLSIDGVDRLVTRRMDTDETFNGLSLYYWNPSFPDLDKKSITNNFTLLDFECYYFEGLSNILNKINIVETTSFV
jgi:hypothetical protein